MSTLRARTAGPLALVAAAALLAGCGAAADGTPGADTPSPTATGTGTGTTPRPLPAGLSEARAAWKAAAVKDYTLEVRQTCLCPALKVTAVVEGGTVVTTDVEQHDRTPKDSVQRAARRYPHTVEALFAMIEKYAPDRLDVTYSPQGVPLSVVADPMPDAVDDEFTYTVLFDGRSGGTLGTPDGAWSPATLPAGVAWSGEQDGEPGAQATIVRRGGAQRLYLGLWGSSSCPHVPLTLRAGEVRTTPKGRVLTLGVDVDGTLEADRACTADYGPTTYVADLPSTTAGGDTSLRVQVVLSITTGQRGDPAVSAAVLPALPR